MKDDRDTRPPPPVVLHGDFLEAFLVLMDHSNKLVVSNFVQSLPQIFNHFEVSEQAFNKILEMINHKGSDGTNDLSLSIFKVMTNADMLLYEKV